MFQIYYRSSDRFSRLNGLCAPVANGAEFEAVWPEAEPESDDVTAAELVDQLAIGETIRFWLYEGDVDVTRLA
jgi:hypothetical protein